MQSYVFRFVLCLLGLLVLFGQACCVGQPNVVVFVSDDHRADLLGCAGHPVLQTPSLDRLAAEGVRFSNAFVTTSICAASRASILTGLVERTHGYTFGTAPLSKRWCRSSYPARLRAQGYRTGFVGKFGVNVVGGRSTIDSMFDSFVPLGRTPYIKAQADGSKRHVTDLTGDRALEFLRNNPAGTPFCLSVSFNAAHAEDGDTANHYPFPATEAGLYAEVDMARPHLDDPAIYESHPEYLKESLNRDRYAWRWDTPEKYDRNMRNYLRMLTGLDRNIGRVIAELEARDLLDSTVIVFVGDNGYYMGERGFAGKWTHFDQALRVPFIIRDPRVAPDLRGRVVEQIALNIDVAPTVLAAAGAPLGSADQGLSLLPLVRRATPRWNRDGFYCEHRMVHDRIPRWHGYRTQDFMYAKYLDVEENGEWLHGLRSDPDQLVNVIADPAQAPDLTRLREQTLRAANAAALRSGDLPRVLLLGDSISMGYHQFVVQALEGEATVMRPQENCAGTTRGIERLEGWLTLDGGEFDVIHFNFGLHDLKRVKPGGANSNDPADGRQAEPAEYASNLRDIVERLRATNTTLVFATTTPVPTGGVRPYRDPTDVERYNDVARELMAEFGIPVNDLYSHALTRLSEIQQPVNVHFSTEGSRALATEVVRSVRESIRRSRTQR